MAHEEDFIQHLSKEIETQANAIMTFRTRIGFTVFIGPFVLLGSFMVGTKRVPHIEGLTPGTIAVLVVLGVCYLALGLVGGLIERGVWRQCNRWRALIATLVDRKDVDPNSDNVMFPPRPLLLTWIVAFALFFVSFLVLVFLISSVWISLETGLA